MATVLVDVGELPGRLAEFAAQVERGDEVVVTIGGKPTVKLSPIPPAEKPRREWKFNLHPGAMIMAPNFDDYIDEDDFLKGNF